MIPVSIAPLFLIVMNVLTSRPTTAVSLRGSSLNVDIIDPSLHSILREVEALDINNQPSLDFSCSVDPAICERTSYNEYYWSELCPYLQDMAKDHLGYNQTSWDQGVWSPVFNNRWRDLTWEEKRASELFCWGEEFWCSEDSTQCDYTQYGTYEWDDLCDYLQEEAKVLGFDEEKWSKGEWVEAQEYSWHTLPQSPGNMTKAATAFCYNETSWNDVTD